MQHDVASRLAPLLTRILGADLPVQVRAWDGSTVGPAGTPVFVIRHRRALRRLLWKPGEMGLVRAYVAGELDIEGDVFAALGAVQRVLRSGDAPIRLGPEDKREIVRTAVMLGAVGPEPKPPPEEFPVSRHGYLGHSPHSAPAAHSDESARSGHPGRKAREGWVGRAGRAGHESVPEAPPEGPLDEHGGFFEYLLGATLAYGCARWDEAYDLDGAQTAALDAVIDRLGLVPGAKVLDLSCGWGSFALKAARRGARVVGLTRSEDRARQVSERLRGTEAAGQVEIRVGDHRAAGAGPYDAIVGLTGVDQVDVIASDLYGLLAPAGRLVVHQLVRRPGPHRVRRTFTTSYMFPEDGELRALGAVVTALEEAGLEVRGTTALREQYARTLRAWAANLEQNWAECGRLASPGRARVWLLYLATSALACEAGRIGFDEIVVSRRDREGRAGEAVFEGRAVAGH